MSRSDTKAWFGIRDSTFGILRDRSFKILTIHLGDKLHINFFGTGFHAFEVIGAIPKTFLIHLLHHILHAFFLFDLALWKLRKM